MELLLNRYRSITALMIVLLAQLLLLAYQVKTGEDVRLIRVWAVTGVMPLARVVDAVRTNTVGVARKYADLVNAQEENVELKQSVDRLKLENQFLKTELGTADRAQALALFQSRSQSKTVAARIVGSDPDANAKVVFVDRGTNSGVGKGMAVVTPDGIVGKVIATYPRDSQVVLLTDPGFAAGVISQQHRVRGTLKGLGTTTCLVDYIPNEEKIAIGELFYTSGDDRVFPKGLPVGKVKFVRQGKSSFQEIVIEPSGFQQGLEEVLIVLEGVHQPIPPPEQTSQELHLLPPPPADEKTDSTPAVRGSLNTDADEIADRYRRLREARNNPDASEAIPREPAP